HGLSGKDTEHGTELHHSIEHVHKTLAATGHTRLSSAPRGKGSEHRYRHDASGRTFTVMHLHPKSSGPAGEVHAFSERPTDPVTMCEDLDAIMLSDRAKFDVAEFMSVFRSVGEGNRRELLARLRAGHGLAPQKFSENARAAEVSCFADEFIRADAHQRQS